jgi:hypothetical protein
MIQKDPYCIKNTLQGVGTGQSDMILGAYILQVMVTVYPHMISSLHILSILFFILSISIT